MEFNWFTRSVARVVYESEVLISKISQFVALPVDEEHVRWEAEAYQYKCPLITVNSKSGCFQIKPSHKEKGVVILF